jgi:hypothetical protein
MWYLNQLCSSLCNLASCSELIILIDCLTFLYARETIVWEVIFWEKARIIKDVS